MVSCAVIFISASEVSGVGGRCDLVFSVVWLSKNWISMRFVRAVFAFFCGDCPVFSTLTKANATLPTKLGWSGARAVMVVVVLVMMTMVMMVAAMATAISSAMTMEAMMATTR